jgi:peptidyl-prolyl cis-trans isomerase SurA
MKKKVLFLALTFISITGFSQVDPIIMEVGGKKITKSEFLQIYLKNNPSPLYDNNSLDEYMELFTKFKLKVAEAEALGYDTIPKLKKELEGYRKQLSAPYLIDSAKNDAMVLEAYERTKLEIRASHILIRLEPTALPADTLIAYNKIMAIKTRLSKGEKFIDLAKTKSEDPSAQTNGGDLGFFTAFQMVYPFEDAAFKTKIGEISNPVRTKFGYHLINVVDSRPARGTIKTAHIMVATTKNSSPEDIEIAKKKADEIYAKLQNGEKFEDLVKNYSDDPSSNTKEGVLPAFGSGTTTRMVTEFENAAFDLKKNGDYSKPVKTDYGFHIIKRIEWTDVAKFEVAKKDLQNKVNKDERAMKTQDSYVLKLKKSYGYQDKSKKTLKWFNSNLDSTYFMGKWNADKLLTNKPIFKLDGKSYTQKDFAAFLIKNQRSVAKDIPENVVKSQLKKWEKESILGYEESKLESKYPDFKALMNEYHDGIILYEIMTDKVWNMAMQDTNGLKAYFNENRSKYNWGTRIDAVVYECYNKEIADKVYKMIQNDTINSKNVIDVINKESELNLRVRTNKFDKDQTPYLKDKNIKKGINPAYEFEGKYYIIKVTEILAPAPKELNESKGAITSDFQNYLEKKWLDQLAIKHTVKVNKEVLHSLGK